MPSRNDRPRLEQKILAAAREIAAAEPVGEDLFFLHSGLAQLGLPRRDCSARRFERSDGRVSILVTAGELWDGERWVPQLLPYGTRPRLVLLYLCTQAVRSRSRQVCVERDAKAFFGRLGLAYSGGPNGSLTAFRVQLGGLAACRLQIGLEYMGHTVTLNQQLIDGFSGWVTSKNGGGRLGQARLC